MYRRQHTFEILKDLMVPDSQYHESRPFKFAAAGRIGFNVLGMLSTIHLNDQSGLQTREIHHIVQQWNLPAEFAPRHLPVAKMRPQDRFGTCLGFAEPAGVVVR